MEKQRKHKKSFRKASAATPEKSETIPWGGAMPAAGGAYIGGGSNLTPCILYMVVYLSISLSLYISPSLPLYVYKPHMEYA